MVDGHVKSILLPCHNQPRRTGSAAGHGKDIGQGALVATSQGIDRFQRGEISRGESNLPPAPSRHWILPPTRQDFWFVREDKRSDQSFLTRTPGIVQINQT